MEIQPLTGTIGAEVTGLQLGAMTPATFDLIEQAFADHLVLCFRDQQMTPESLLALTHRFGGPGDTPYLSGLPGYPDIVPVIKEADEKSPITFGSGWHTDFTFQSKPPARTLLYAVDVPEVGGDTLYTSLYAAWDSLSEGLKSALLPLWAVHSAVRSYGPNARLKDQLEHMSITNEEAAPGTFSHPVVRRHPVSGRAALWINPTYTLHFEGMTAEESEPLLDYLNQQIISPGFGCRVRWRPGTLTMWDNRCTQHCATSDYRGHRREMWRTTTAGEQPIAFGKDW